MSMKACVILLSGLSVLFSTDCESAAVPSTTNSSGGNNNTTDADHQTSGRLLTTGHAIDVAAETRPTQAWAQATTQEPPKVTVRTENTSSSKQNAAMVTTKSSFPRLFSSTTSSSLSTNSPNAWSKVSATVEDSTSQLSDSGGSASTAATVAPVTKPEVSTTGLGPLFTFQPVSGTISHISTPTADLERSSLSQHISDTTSQVSSSETQRGFDGTSSAVTTLKPSTNGPDTTSQVSTKYLPHNTSSTSEVLPLSDQTSSPVTKSTTSTTGFNLLSTSQLISDTTHQLSTRQFLSPTSSTPAPGHSTTNVPSTSSVSTGSSIPYVPKKLPVPSTTPAQTNLTTKLTTPATTTPPCAKNPSCFTRGLVKKSLITITCLAVLATIFMVSTIVMCTRRSARKYKVQNRQQSTEMMCISSLMPDRNYTYTRQRNPVPNGILVLPNCDDSEDDGGDNLTLSSFLPENDRFL